MVDNNLEKLCLQKFSLVRATNSNSRGDQSPFNLFDSPVALNPQPSSTMTMQEVTHSTTVPCSLNSLFRKTTIPLTMDFSKWQLWFFNQLLIKQLKRKFIFIIKFICNYRSLSILQIKTITYSELLRYNFSKTSALYALIKIAPTHLCR